MLPALRHKIYPYLLRHLTIDQPNHVWCGCHLPSNAARLLYLVAAMDWASRKVLTWRLSNTMDADFCVVALEKSVPSQRCLSGAFARTSQAGRTVSAQFRASVSTAEDFSS